MNHLSLESQKHTLSKAKIKVITSSCQHFIYLLFQFIVSLAFKDVILTLLWSGSYSACCSVLMLYSPVLFLHYLSSFKISVSFSLASWNFYFVWVTGSLFYQHLYSFNYMFNPSMDVFCGLIVKSSGKQCKKTLHDTCLQSLLLALFLFFNWS